MTGLFLSLDEYIVPAEVTEVEIAMRYLSMQENESYDYYPSKMNDR